MRLINMNWKQAEAYFQTHDMVILTTGSIECHGRHNPLGTDTLIPMKLLDLIEERSDVMILPTLPYGDCDWHLDFPGAISIGSDLLCATVERICDCLYQWGVRRFIMLNGHGGNTHALEKAACYLDRKGAVSVIINWWVTAGEINPAWKGGHGAGQETAAVLAVDPALVDRSAISEDEEAHDPTENLKSTGLRRVSFKGVDVMLPRTNRQMVDNGWYGKDHPKDATEEWGKEMLAATADFVVELMAEVEKIQLRGE